MVDKLSKEELEEYKEAFAYYDRDRDGKITAQEFGTVIRSLGHAPSQKQLAAIIKEIGENTKLDFPEFVTVAVKHQVKCGGLDEILEAFRVFDKDGAGLLPSSELKYSMVQLGEKLTDLEAEYMLMEAGVDADNKVNYESFVKDMMKYK